MKKFFYMAVAAIAALSSCSSDDAILSEDGKQNGEGVTTFTATIESEATTRTTLTIDKKVMWLSSDVIMINGKEYKATNLDGVKADFVPVTEGQTAEAYGGKYYAFYPSTILQGWYYDKGMLPASYEYKSDLSYLPMYAQSENTTLAFKNLCGVLAITVPSSQMASVKSIVVSSDKRMNGEFTATADGVLTFSTAASDEAAKKVTLTFSEAKTISGSETFYIPIPAGVHNPIGIEVTDGTNTKVMTTKGGGVTIVRNKIYPITFADNQTLVTDANLIQKWFSVSRNKKVQFTKGNLYWDGSNFQLEANQYDYQTSWNASHVSHFYWTKTAADSYAATYSSGSETTTDRFFADGVIDSNGTNDHQITIGTGSDQLKGLYALTTDEWKYLLQKRTNYNKLYKFGVSVAEKANCLIIAPDGYDYTANPLKASYDATAWTAAEALGLVCLPAAGYRSDSTFKRRDEYGYCWSSTPYSEESAYSLYFISYSAFPSSNQNRSEGISLRLVK